MNTGGVERSQQRPIQGERMPSDIGGGIGFFDRFAGSASRFASRAPFFAFCVFLVVAWLAEGVVRAVGGDGLGVLLDDKYQLQINTTTTIVTFLMVALLQNSATRGDQSTQHKLNAVADGLADLMERIAERYDDDELRQDVEELRAAVGLEERETTSQG
ncbi:MAG: low affinity iron permease family protein [Actinomycetota bacterium]|nr:low affinity iron permease family protein [Actinomycetota bacterium]